MVLIVSCGRSVVIASGT